MTILIKVVENYFSIRNGRYIRFPGDSPNKRLLFWRLKHKSFCVSRSRPDIETTVGLVPISFSLHRNGSLMVKIVEQIMEQALRVGPGDAPTII